MDTQAHSNRSTAIVLAGAGLLALAFGVRSVLGMFLSPLNTATGLGFATISFALAVSQLASGIAQPVWGAAADRHGPARVVVIGALLLACGFVLLAFARGVATLAAAFCIIATACAAVGSTPTLLGAVTRSVAESRRGLAIGIVSAGGSVGQLVCAPITQLGIAALGGTATIIGLALASLAALPAARAFSAKPSPGVAAGAEPQQPVTSARVALRAAFTAPSYWLICAGFCVCGFHVAFLLAHMPGVIELCGMSSRLTGIWLGILGLSNVAGSIVSGMVIKRFAMTRILFVVYAVRALGVALFLLAPKTESVMLGFAVWMGFTYMATLPPTSGLVGKRFGTRHMGSLFGVVMLVHQLGSFLGVWLGGVALEIAGSYDWVWRADIALAVLAALIHLPIRELPLEPGRPAARRLSAQPA